RGAIGQPARPAHFKITTADGRPLDFTYRDVNNDRTVSLPGELIDVFTPVAEGTSASQVAWRFEAVGDAQRPPGAGDVFRLAVDVPFGPEDAFTFTTRGAFLDATRAADAFAEEKPYVVPNPYVASASFEPERFATSGRGERRLEFRAIPAGAVIHIYTVRGELVQTLRHDGSIAGVVPWNLRTKDNLDVAPGLYVFHVDAGAAGEHVGKFAIIK
ncbi:MAG: hypothetical protein R3247_00695, partial [Rhodothermales bacterium]|nr:hypothetical protein [Rhodothermales bacterium]